MNNTRFFVAIASLLLLASGCAMNDVDSGSTPALRSGASPIFTSSFENAETRTYVDSDLYMYWTADDRLSIFTSSYNEQYRFDGQTGATGGSFSKVNTGQFVTGNPISTNYGVYPYNASTALTKDEKIEFELPAVQQYAVNSFGVGANTMVAVTGGTNDFFLPFKNVCGYLVVKLYGDVTVKKVTFEGNNGEKIAGAATVVASHNSNPEITMSENATTSITIDCGEGVELGKTVDTATEFWFVIPPTTFSNGFTIKAMGDGVMMMKKSTSASRTIQRNIANSMPAIEAVFDTPIEGNVEFEDANFKAYCVTNFDKNHDGEVSYAEALDVTSIVVNTDNIESMSGIEHFANLTYLACTGNVNGKLSSLDVSKNTELARLNCNSNQLTSLDVSKNTKLTSLYCGNNPLTSLDVSNNTSLLYLHCDSNQLTSLDVSNNTSLQSLVCDSNQLTSLDVSNNTSLQNLYCYTNQLTSLDVSKNTTLRILDCHSNQLTSLDVSNNTSLQSLNCGANQLTSLDVSNNTSLEYLYCYTNQLTSLDVSKNTTLRYLDCRNNPALAILWMKRGQSISSLYDSSITTIKYVDDFEQFEAVDLGLSVKWASCNVGASRAEEYGGYYAWGETKTKSDYSWSTYKWCKGSNKTLTKYCNNSSFGYNGFTDTKTVLALEDDVARTTLGGTWRMPTEEEFEELKSNCDGVWTTQNGVSGYKFTARNGSGNSIFLPAAGCRLNVALSDAGIGGYYWSSSLYEYYSVRARDVYFGDTNVHRIYGYRYYGQSVRPVCD